MIHLNETGGEIWELLKEETTEEKVLREILERYEIGEEQAKKKKYHHFNGFINIVGILSGIFFCWRLLVGR